MTNFLDLAIVDEQVRQNLLAAAHHIETYGHIKGDAYGEGDIHTAPACLLGAICLFSDYHTRDLARKRLTKHLGLGDETPLSAWNDHPDTTPEDVINALREAANASK